MKRLTVVVTVAMLAATGLVSAAPAADAANADDFEPGHIISDAVFYNSSAMTVAEIESFLDGKGAACTSGSVPCLKDFVQNTASRSDSWGRCATYQGKSNQSAAMIIVDIARACGVNPQVLLVLLEKEQSLVSTRTPTARRYEIATGYGCPDTAACDELYYGFVNQLFRAARQYQQYRANPTSYSHIAGRVNSIAYYPLNHRPECGSGDVYIQNQATAGLYNYTPYQPNVAALDNLYGTGDYCSSYGNRNFWRIFTDWFGSTTHQGHRISDKRDWNGDSYADIIARRTDGRLYFYAGRAGRMSFTKTVYGPGWTPMTAFAQSHNIMGNGHPEVFAIDPYGRLFAYEGVGNGVIATRGQVGHGWTSMDILLGLESWGPDQRPALLSRHKATGNVYVYPSNGRGGFIPNTRLEVDWNVYDGVWYAGDWDSDGTEDLVARRSDDGHLYLLSGRRDGTFASERRIGTNWRGITEVYGGGDWDQDGSFDLMGRSTDGRLWLFSGNSAGGFGGTTQAGHGWATFDFAD